VATCKMTVDNLAVVFAPTVIGYSTAEPSMNHIITQTKLQQLVQIHNNHSLTVCLSVSLSVCLFV